MATLWLKFSEETSLPNRLNIHQQETLNALFDDKNPDSTWNKATLSLGLKYPKNQLLLWHHGTPYMNWSAMVEMVSCGCLQTIPDQQGGFAYQGENNLLGFLRLIRAQWKIESYLYPRLSKTASLPQSQEERLCESIVLGFVILSLTLRLPKHDPKLLATWLLNPNQAPTAVRKTLSKLQAVQTRRTLLSSTWNELFQMDGSKVPEGTPDFFWDSPPSISIQPKISKTIESKKEWKGLPVCSGDKIGPAICVDLRNTSPDQLKKTDEKPILIFSQARPEAIEYFQYGSAILFSEGGVLSHACTIAREQGIPCITGLGREFYHEVQALIQAHQRALLIIDCGEGVVRLV